MKLLLEAKNVEKIYGKGESAVKALKGVSLSIASGEFCLLLGASGSGKSTLLHILGTLDKPTSGNVLYRGKDVFLMKDSELSRFRNLKLGFIFQFHYLIDELSVLENVMLPLLIRGVERRRAEEEAVEILKIVGLEHRLSHRPFEISGGEQQRTAVARALVGKPEIVLADEPTGNLDSENALNLISLMVELKERLNTSFLVATHDLELEKFADRTYYIKDGKIIQSS